MALVLVVVPAFGAAVVAPRLALRGWPGMAREGELVFAPALRAPRDSTLLATTLRTASERLQAEGWLDARVRAAWNVAGDPELTVDVQPGPAYRWGALVIDGAPADSAEFARGLALLATGPASPPLLAAAIERSVVAAEAAGYAWASLGVSGWAADSGRVRVRLSGTLGPRVIVREARIDGLVTTRPDVAARALGKLTGQPYDPATARIGTQRLQQLGVFRRVEYLGLAGGADWQQGVLHWKVEEPRYNTFEGAVGVQGDAGVTGLAHLELGNLVGTARTLGLSWQSRGKGLSDFSAHYREPLVMGSPVALELALSQQIQDTLYTRFRYGAKGSVALGAGEHVEAGFEEERVAQPRGDVQNADLQNSTFALERDLRDDPLNPRRGTRLRIAASEVFNRETLRPVDSTGVTTRNTHTSALETHVDWSRRLAANTGLSLETSAAAHFGPERVAPDWERYPLGGAATLRGHSEEEFKVDRYVLTRLEWRWFLSADGTRAALFWDHAAMQTREATLDSAGVQVGERLDRAQADGLGFGLRLPAAGGVVDLDYGLAPGRSFLEGKIHLQLVTTF